jgi:hypothetical protein
MRWSRTHLKDMLTRRSGIASSYCLFAFRREDHSIIAFFDQALGDQFLHSGVKGDFLLGVVMDHFLDVKWPFMEGANMAKTSFTSVGNSADSRRRIV